MALPNLRLFGNENGFIKRDYLDFNFAALGGVASQFNFVPLVNDGVYTTGAGTDNTAALQAALAAISTAGVGGTCLYVGPGIFKLTSQVIIPDGVSIIGTGKWSTIFFCPTSFSNTGGLFRTASTGSGSPTNFSGVGILAQNGGCSGTGLVSVKNGMCIRDIWSSGYANAIALSNTDNFLSDFIIELCTTGVFVTESNVNMTHGEVFGCSIGVQVSNNAGVGGIGAVTLSNVRATQCPLNGFIVSAGRNVQLTGCSVDHVNGGQFVNGGLVVSGGSAGVNISNFRGKLGTQSGTGAAGILVDSSSDVTISGGQVTGWQDGVRVQNACIRVSTSDVQASNNLRRGIYMVGGDQISAVGNQCFNNGSAGAVTEDRKSTRLNSSHW